MDTTTMRIIIFYKLEKCHTSEQVSFKKTYNVLMIMNMTEPIILKIQFGLRCIQLINYHKGNKKHLHTALAKHEDLRNERNYEI